jgi:hypothetical protein
MRFREFILLEASNLSRTELLKYGVNSKRVQTFLDRVKNSKPFKLISGGEFIVDPKTYKQVEDMIKNSVARQSIIVTDKEGNTINTNNFVKEPEFGGQEKETLKLKPAHIFPDGRFKASQVFKAVTTNSVLQGTDYGKIVIDLANQIEKGNNPDLGDTPGEYHKAIRDYAGEYLGVLALLKGIANFPNQDAWYNHLGVSDLKNITMFFPSKQNNPLADSEGYFENADTGNRILVSSKGGQKGAPPSLNNLKIPDHLRTEEYNEIIKFVESLQGADARTQPFYGLNALMEIVPEKIPGYIKKILPFSEGTITKLGEWTQRGKKSDLFMLPKVYQKLVENYVELDRVKDEAPVGGLVHYAVNNLILDIVNDQKAIPQFDDLAREILQHNFIQIHTFIDSNKLTFSVVWPNREMATGNIALYSKSSASNPAKGRLSFSVY